MSCTLADIADQLAPSAGSAGICLNTDADMADLLRQVNEVLPLLLKRLDSKGSLARWEIPVFSSTFALPHDCLEVRQAFLNGASVQLRDQFFEAGTLGYQFDCAGRQCGPRDLVDLGDNHAIPFEWPNHHFDSRLGLVAEHDADAGKQVQVRVKDRYGNEVEEFLTLLPDQQAVQTESVVTDVKFLRKGATKGAVRAYVNYSTGARTLACRYHPRVQVASFRKKRLPQSWGSCGGELQLIGKMRFLPLVSEFDPLPICDVASLSFGLQALEARRNRDYSAYNNALLMATNELLKEMSSEQSAGVVTQMAVKSPLGRNRRCWL